MGKLTWHDLTLYADNLPEKFRHDPVRVCVYGSFLDCDLRECEDNEDFIMDDGTPYLEVE
jgi:hypothetical protein